MKGKKNQIIYLILSYAVWGVFWGGWGVLLPAVKDSTGATDAMLGVALVGISIGALPAMLGTGIFVRRFTKWVLFSGLLFFSLSIAAITFAHSPLTLAIILFFVGSSSGILDVIMNSGVATLESISGKRYFNYAHAAFPVAVIVTSPVVGLARQTGVGIEIILLSMAAIVALIGILSLNLQLEGKINDKEEFEETTLIQKKIILTKSILIFGFVGLLVHLMENAVEQWSAIYLEQHLLSNPAIASLGLTGYMAMLFVGRIIAQKVSNIYSDKMVMGLSSFISVLGFLLVAISSKPYYAILGYSLAGMGIAPIVPIIFSLTGKSVASAQRVRAISTVTVIAYSGYLISPPFFGYISSLFGLKSAWLILTLTALFLVFIIYRLPAGLYISENSEGLKI